MGTNSFVNLPTVGVGYAATVLAATPTELTSFTTLGPLTEGGYTNGQEAFVQSSGTLYVLRSAVGTADGFSIIATNDDPTRQWVAWNYSIFFTSQTVYFCIDATNGNDATAVASPTLSIAAASPFKTTEAARAAIGFFGNGGKAICLLKPGSYGTIDMTDEIGFKSIIWCGSDDFSRSTLDKRKVGDVIVPGTSSAGYTVVATTITPTAVDYTSTPVKVTAAGHGLNTGDCIFGQGFGGLGTIANAEDGYLNGYWVATVIDANTFSLNLSRSIPNLFGGTSGTYTRWKLTVVGGGTPAFTVDGIVGKRFRWASNTPTVALQNTALGIIMNDTGSVVWAQAPTATIAAGDFGFITQPGIIVNNIVSAFNSPGSSVAPVGGAAVQAMQYVGIQGTTWNLRGMDRTTFCEGVTSFTASTAGVGGTGEFDCSNSYTDETGITVLNMGTGFLGGPACGCSISSYRAFPAYFFSTRTANIITFSNVIQGTMTSGAYFGGVEFLGCGTPGSSAGNQTVGSYTIIATAGNTGVPRFIASPNNSALSSIGSSLNIAAADVSNATNASKAGIAIGGTRSMVRYQANGNLSGRNNSYGISFGSAAASQFDSACDSYVTIASANGYGLFGNLVANYLMGNNTQITNYPFFDASFNFAPTVLYRLEDQLKNTIGPNSDNVPYARLIRAHTTFNNATGSTISRALMTRVTTGGVDTSQNCALAQADSAAHAKGLLGPALCDIATANLIMISLLGQPGLFKVDLSGGHVAAVQGDTFYLSQTTAGLVQTDLPGSGIVKIVGTAIGPSDANGYTWGIVGSQMG